VTFLEPARTLGVSDLEGPLVRRTLVTLTALAMLAVPFGSVALAAPSPLAQWLPPAYLVWRTGGFHPGIESDLARMPGVRRSVVVAGDEAWMTRSVRKAGAVVDDPPAPFAVPIDTMAAKGKDYVAFVPGTYRDEILHAFAKGQGVLGQRSASMRRLKVGDRMVFGRNRVVVGAIVPDEVASWSELLVPRPVGVEIGVTTPRFALLQMAGAPRPPTLAARVLRLNGPGYPISVKRPGTARFRRQADATWPQILMKQGFGEFAARPSPGHPGYLQMSGAFVHRHLATRSVPLLGRATCNVAVFPALISAMNQLRRRGLAGLVRNFAGCYAARTVMRRANGPISHHSWGGAVDINSITNPYGAPPHQDGRLVAVMAAHGFTWGGRWTVPDGMHFEYEVPGIAP
jgi:D-alanyl-D-alanine carboxypeptidase